MTSNTDTPNDDVAPDEMATLKERAKTLGLRVSPNIGLDALREKVRKALEGDAEDVSADESEEENESPETAVAATADANVGTVATEQKLTAAEQLAKDREELIANCMRLVRVRITNMNPSKKDLSGEIFTVANGVLGTVKKFVPYGEATDEGYHLPFIIYDELRERKFLQVTTRKDQKRPGHMIVEERWAKEFAIEVLPQLTEDELKRLATQQAAAAGM